MKENKYTDDDDESFEMRREESAVPRDTCRGQRLLGNVVQLQTGRSVFFLLGEI